MAAMRLIMPVGASLLLGACGLYVPEIQENPLDGNEGQKFVQEIALNIRCEVQNAVIDLYAANAPVGVDFSNFDTWGVQIALTLTIDEKGSLNPIVSWLPTGT